MPTSYEKEMERLRKLLAENETDDDSDFDNEDIGPEDISEENFSDHENFSEHDTESEEDEASKSTAKWTPVMRAHMKTLRGYRHGQWKRSVASSPAMLVC
ncbi:hypothetical protein AVEN_100729-1 [Araneus ventricosus]|uniref:Uncharacterized protein n=1 Tax=Araneus ventricosus TaxID=182803 RepID=A0A4Y2CT51_ARAVE|nr:hypothetical protein AVEN_100729-1 [Araneus ventricosus]